MADRIFCGTEEAALMLGTNETQVRELVSRGQLTEYRDRDSIVFKIDQVKLLTETKPLSEAEAIFDLQQEERANISDYPEGVQPGMFYSPKATPEASKDRMGTAMLVSWILCAVVFCFSVFARRLYLLETIVPIFAFAGVILLGVNLYQHWKNRQKRLEEIARSAETDKLLNQVERIKTLNEKRDH